NHRPQRDELRAVAQSKVASARLAARTFQSCLHLATRRFRHHRACEDDNVKSRFRAERAADCLTRRKDVAKRKAARWFAWRADHDESRVRIPNCLLGILAGTQPALRFLDQFGESGLVNGRHSSIERVHFLRVYVHRMDLKASGGKARGYRRTKFPQTHYRN